MTGRARTDALLIGPRGVALLTQTETHALALYFDAAARSVDLRGVAPVDVDAAWCKLRDAGLIPDLAS